MMAQSYNSDSSRYSEQYSTSVNPNGLHHDNRNQNQDRFGAFVDYNALYNDATTRLDILGGSATTARDLHEEPDSNLAASDSQYPEFVDRQVMLWDNSAPQEPTTEVELPFELPSTYSFEASQPYGIQNPSISSVEWNDATNYPSYGSQHQPITDFGPLAQWDTQYPRDSQFSTSFSPMDNLVSPAQMAPSHEDLRSNYSPSYAEQYLLDIEAREDDTLSIHVRIPPSIPGAMYYGTHLISEFSQDADGTIDFRVHLPAGCARVSSTFVHA
ncbi:uncharacterized protein STEHIDRAFT_144697 [Stereum hirsutum FP-91666 SS1]|uniref:uncharacterized protein n=1 Tax=Stereum hirsutum (strain FP-91666) TaxID=721885 RepID=UPI000440A817|nr:uncharacterized protein STEHIDRAFT_144697 [Stereum hirsutum FP-91666 SS1]EIM91390.1 hypothetical protein STEHIDRAFT_144697 [Stereum hirsutum FP-91666 SS1]